MPDTVALIIWLIAGIAGGNAAGDLLKGNYDLGPGNTIAGAIGGIVGALILQTLIPVVRGFDVVPAGAAYSGRGQWGPSDDHRGGNQISPAKAPIVHGAAQTNRAAARDRVSVLCPLVGLVEIINYSFTSRESAGRPAS